MFAPPPSLSIMRPELQVWLSTLPVIWSATQLVIDGNSIRIEFQVGRSISGIYTEANLFHLEQWWIHFLLLTTNSFTALPIYQISIQMNETNLTYPNLSFPILSNLWRPNLT